MLFLEHTGKRLQIKYDSQEDLFGMMTMSSL